MKKTFFGIIILSLILLQSCASKFYKDKNRVRNNTITIKSNYNDFSFASKGKQNLEYNKFNQMLTITPLTKKSTKITFSRLDCYDISFQVKRTPRLGAVLSDIPLSIFFGMPFIIDVFRPDFYKISNKHKTIELYFQKTDDYFKKKVIDATNQSKSNGWAFENRYKKTTVTTPPTQHEFNSILLLDSLLEENPSNDLKNHIELNKIKIIKSLLYRDIYKLDLKWSKYIGLNLKYRVLNKSEINLILDSIQKVSIDQEISYLNNNKDLIFYFDLFEKADSLFKIKLSNIKPEIENAFLNSISKDFNFRKLKTLENKDTSSINKYNDFRVNLEKKLVAQLNSNYDHIIFEENYNMVSLTCRKELDIIRKKVTDEESFNKFKAQIIEIENYIISGRFEEALALIYKIEFDTYASNNKENLQIIKLKNKAIQSFIKVKIEEYISKIKVKIQNGESPFPDINAPLNNYLYYSSDITFGNVESIVINYQNNRTLSVEAKPYNNDKLINFNASDLSQNQRKDLNNIIKKETVRLEQLNRKRTTETNRNLDSDNSNSKSKAEMTLCATESGYNSVTSYKLYFYKGGAVQIEFEDGKINFGRFTTYDGSIYVRIAGFQLVLDQGYGNNFIDKQGREWRQCWY